MDFIRGAAWRLVKSRKREHENTKLNLLAIGLRTRILLSFRAYRKFTLASRDARYILEYKRAGIGGHQVGRDSFLLNEKMRGIANEI